MNQLQDFFFNEFEAVDSTCFSIDKTNFLILCYILALGF